DFHVTGVQTCALPIFLTLTLRDLQANGSTSWGSGLRLHALRLGGNWRMGLVAETWEEPDGVRSLPAGVESWHWGGEISGNLGGEIGRASCRERLAGSG